jgi:hypothetical protein
MSISQVASKYARLRVQLCGALGGNILLSQIVRAHLPGWAWGVLYVVGYWGTSFACIMYFQWSDMVAKQQREESGS